MRTEKNEKKKWNEITMMKRDTEKKDTKKMSKKILSSKRARKKIYLK